jgi:hypothetical protein
MRLFTSSGRRLAVGLGIACAAALLPAAALAGSGSPGHPVAGRAAVAKAAGATTRCLAPATTVWTGEPGNGTAGTTYYVLEFSNTGHRACTLYGYPGVSASDGSGNTIGVPATHGGPRLLVTIPAGGTAHVILGVVDWGAVCGHPLSADYLKVYAPGQFSYHLTPLSVQVCPDASTLRVDAVHPNAGIPGYSIR